MLKMECILLAWTRVVLVRCTRTYEHTSFIRLWFVITNETHLTN